jgi:N-acyl homoserine lactone hydrolase
MKKAVKIFTVFTAAVLITIAALVLFLFQDGSQTLSSKVYPLPTQIFTDWHDVFKNPADIRVSSLTTGTVKGDRHAVLDETDPNISKIQNRYDKSAVLSYLVQHAQKGSHLVDAGLSKSFSREEGNYSRLLNIVMKLIGVKTEQSLNLDTVSQLSKRGVKPTSIFLTHLHADHTSGVSDFDKSTRVIFGKGEPTFFQKAMMGGHLSEKNLFTIDFINSRPLPPFEKVLDLFGDGSFWAISTEGHSPDHISYLANTKSGPVLMVGDAAAYYAQLTYKIKPTPSVYDVDKAIESLSQLHEFITRYPKIKVLVGHELCDTCTGKKLMHPLPD